MSVDVRIKSGNDDNKKKCGNDNRERPRRDCKGDPRVKPGDDIRGGVNQGMIPGEMSGTSLNMTDKRKPEYDGKDGERDKSEKLIFFLKNQLICYRFADSSKNRPAPFGACGHVLTI